MAGVGAMACISHLAGIVRRAVVVGMFVAGGRFF